MQPIIHTGVQPSPIILLPKAFELHTHFATEQNMICSIQTGYSLWQFTHISGGSTTSNCPFSEVMSLPVALVATAVAALF